MSRPSAPFPERPQLAVLVCRAVAAFESLSPELKRAHVAAQRRSWVIGNMLLDHPEMTRERAEAIYDRVRSEAA